ncbi:MAG: DNA primase [Gammaproteobacteria bacterium]|nr:DNA primase [Gammaproteobacteria bacterium]
MAGRIPQDFIDGLLGRVDIVDVVHRFVQLRQAGANYKGLCPFHEEKSPSFTVSQDKQFYHCFGCGAHGSAINFLMEFSGLGFVEAVEELAGIAGVEVPRESNADDAREDVSRELYETNEAVARFFANALRHHPAHDRAVDYLKKRGLSGTIARDFELGFAPPEWDGLLTTIGNDPPAVQRLLQLGLVLRNERNRVYDRFRDRVIFPIRDQRGRMVGFGGRIIDQGEPKYLNSPESPIFHKGQELYGLHRARKAIRDQLRVIVVEGYMDVVALAQHGVDNAVATLGTATTVDHLQRLFRMSPEVVFCFDGDEAGRRAAWRALLSALPLLTERRYVSFMFLPAGEDPDTLVRTQGAAYFTDPANAKPLSEVMFEQLSDGINLHTMTGKASLTDKAMPLIEQIPEGTFKTLLAEQLANLVRLPQHEMRRMQMAGTRAATTSTPPPSSRATAGKGPSNVRAAITQLLQHPNVALQASAESVALLTASRDQGHLVLAELIDLVRSNPTLTTGTLLERYRDHRLAPHFAALLTDVIDLGPEGAQTEFSAAGTHTESAFKAAAA